MKKYLLPLLALMAASSVFAGEAFYTDSTDKKLIRLSFAKDEATLRAGAQALCQVKPR